MTPSQVYLSKNGDQQGPFSISQLEALLQVGHITSDDLCCYDGCETWIPLAQLPGFVATPELRAERAEPPAVILQDADAIIIAAAPAPKPREATDSFHVSRIIGFALAAASIAMFACGEKFANSRLSLGALLSGLVGALLLTNVWLAGQSRLARWGSSLPLTLMILLIGMLIEKFDWTAFGYLALLVGVIVFLAQKPKPPAPWKYSKNADLVKLTTGMPWFVPVLTQLIREQPDDTPTIVGVLENDFRKRPPETPEDMAWRIIASFFNWKAMSYCSDDLELDFLFFQEIISKYPQLISAVERKMLMPGSPALLELVEIFEAGVPTTKVDEMEPGRRTWISRNGRQQGPFTDVEIYRLLFDRSIAIGDYCFREGMAVWLELAEFYAPPDPNLRIARTSPRLR